MSHQTQLEKAKYRNWVKGGLSMKYLKDGLEKFADDVVRQDHTRILQQIGHTTGLVCNVCTLHDLKPVHKYVLDTTTNRKICPRDERNCNCLYPNKSSCPNKICDAVYEEILNSHASSPPAPCMKNTDITKWITHPWEVAKCFINAPGYKDKQSAEETDVAGLLHVFINNTMYQTSLSCLISGSKSDAFSKVLDLRNKVFHSPNMELEDRDLSECLRNVVSILEDEKKLKDTQCAKEAVDKVNQLQNQEFIITTETEAIVLREIVETKINKLERNNSELTEDHLELEEKHLDLQKRYSALDEKHLELEKGHSELEDKQLELDKGHSALKEKHLKLEKRHSELQDKHLELEKGHSELEDKQLKLKKGHLGLEDKHADLAKKQSELEKSHLNLDKRHSGLEEKHLNLAKGHSGLEREHAELTKGHSEIERRCFNLEKGHSELSKGHSKLEKRHLELEKEHSGLDRKHSDLSKGISELKKTHLKLEMENSEIDKRLDTVEKDVESLKNIHKKQLITVETRLDARRTLADHLLKHYVKTSVSPLKTRENAVDIDKVYVEPKIKTEKEKSTNPNKKRTVSLTSYGSMFQLDGHRMRRIYLIGDVGTGKSAFCKMMILNWCRSVKSDQTKNSKEEAGNIETMKQFDFLFYLPLRRLQKGSRIREMILWYYKDEIPVEVLDDILLNVPEKCLILADGLDEWTPNSDEQRPQHVTGSLPYSGDIKEVTILTTSRPSAPGVLNMASTEFDLKIAVCGIPATSIDLMTEKYISLSKKSNKDIVLGKLKAQKIDHIEKTPLLLQQLIWMLANDIDVGKCLTDNYSSLVNIAMNWTEEKDTQRKLKKVSSCHVYADLHLPSQLVQYDACWSNRNLLFILGKIAFDLLVFENNTDSQMSFGRAKLNRDGLEDDVIDMILTTGLLTEDNCHDNTKQKTQFAFTHASFQEYFAALFIASHNRIKHPSNTGQTRKQGIFKKVWSLFARTKMESISSSDVTHQPHNEDIIEQLFRRFSSVQDILQLELLLLMLCSLDSEILLDVCEHIYQTAQRDINYTMLRDNFLKTTCFPYEICDYVGTTLNMQKLIKSCVLECYRKCDTVLDKVPILDYVIRYPGENEETDLLQYVIQQKVFHLSFIDDYGPIRSDLYQNDITEFRNLQTVAIDLHGVDLSRTFMTALSQHISKTNSIRKIKFTTAALLVGLPVINLLRHHQLQLINIRGIHVINVDTTNLEVIEQTGLYIHGPISELLPQRKVIPRLRHIELSRILATPEVANFISRNVTLNFISLHGFVDLDYISDTGSVNLRCVIDLAAHNYLHVLEIRDTRNVDIRSVNTANLNTVITDSCDVLYAVRNASKLTSLTFGGEHILSSFRSFQFTKQMNENVCSCSQLQEIDLEYVTIEDEALEMNCGMRNLKHITLVSVNMKQSTWIRFVNSLLNLNQSVTVKAEAVKNAGNFRQYIQDNENFKLICDTEPYWFYLNRWMNLKFETAP